MVHDVIVAGAGPAGLFAAIAAAEAGASVLLLERMPSPARKLLASGAGQCNLTHAGPVSDFLGHYGGARDPSGETSPQAAAKAAGKFLKPALYAFGNAELASFCAERGLDLEESEGGKIFPVTRRSRDLLDLLLAEARRLGVGLTTGFRVLSVRREAEGFVVTGEAGGPGEGRELRARNLVLAMGGSSYPSTGSSGDGCLIAAALGHRIAELAPALSPVIVAKGGRPDFSPFAECSGIAIRDTAVLVYREGRKLASGRGDVLLTHRGLSGPAVLDLSRHIGRGGELRVCLAPGHGGPAEVEAALLEESAAHGGRGLARVLAPFGMAENLAKALLASYGLAADAKAALLTKEGRRLLSRSLAEGGDAGHPFTVAALGSWEEAMVTRGGVALDEVDPKSMESRLVPGLFFAGEVLDYDGDTGGYNIQAAFSTGRLAGRSAAGRL
jgi:predicted Rossmann fold flavoprotein